MGLVCFIYIISSLRTNIIFFIIFLTPVIDFACLASAYRNLNLGNVALAGRLQTTVDACTFVTSACGWWIFLAIMLAALNFPFQLPGELNTALPPSRWLWGSNRSIWVLQRRMMQSVIYPTSSEALATARATMEKTSKGSSTQCFVTAMLGCGWVC